MRIRKKKWARQELENSPFYIDNPDEKKGNWKTQFPKKQELFIELGCGKGQFISKMSNIDKEHNFVAIDLIDAMLGLAKRNIEKNEDTSNIILTRYNIEQIQNVFDKNDNVKKIFINFCNPWPRQKHNKRRLTHPRQLEQYKTFLDGEIFFKTDSDELFADSLEYFASCNFDLISKTYDLENEDIFKPYISCGNIVTEHEKMFMDQGIKIKGAIARWKK